MNQVWKFPLDVGENVLDMDPSGTVVHVAAQHGDVTMWALVDPATPTVRRHFVVFGTGWDAVGTYLGTAHVGGFVWHVFEVES